MGARVRDPGPAPRGRGSACLAIGYLALPVALIEAAIASVALILLPLPPRPAKIGARKEGTRRGAALAGFFSLGLAFLMMEIAFIGRFTVILSHPLYALVVGLAAFLVFAGLGSWLAAGAVPAAALAAAPVAAPVAAPLRGRRPASRRSRWSTSPPFPTSRARCSAPAPGVKIAAAVALVAPIATLMGMPFPRALARLRQLDPVLVPWAWGTNGCASVLGAALATLLAVHHGQTFVIGCAALLYGAAAVALSRMGRAPRQDGGGGRQSLSSEVLTCRAALGYRPPAPCGGGGDGLGGASISAAAPLRGS